LPILPRRSCAEVATALFPDPGGSASYVKRSKSL
jgi:hypothetical protein